MALRPAKCVRDMDKPAWTRYSRRRPRKSYIKAMPHLYLNQYRMGTRKEDYDTKISLVAKEDVLLRDNALESARQAVNRYLEKSIAGSYYFVITQFPHHVIRENKMVAAAGADRIQQGMRRAFGKPTSRSARVKKGKAVFVVYTYKKNLPIVKTALSKAPKKLSASYSIIIEEGVGVDI